MALSVRFSTRESTGSRVASFFCFDRSYVDVFERNTAAAAARGRAD
jgi:hypothetical protein